MNNNKEQSERTIPLTGPGTGPQGVDKAPGEESPAHADQFIQETQKGKNKVDGDPSRESDRPMEQS